MELVELMQQSIKELAPLIRNKEISPVELVEACLQRIEETEPSINAFITVLADKAMEDAVTAEQEIMKGNYKGVLHGIPYSAKDLFTTNGIKTTAGSKILADYVPDYDSTAVKRLSEAGAILVGKNNMHEFAFGGTNENEHYGPTRNPWNLDLIPGGSSGGSGATVAASSSIFSLGTDTGGSIRMPAALCGVVGIKASYGRVSRHGVLPLSSSLDHAGPMTKSAWDAAAVLSVIAGYDPLDAACSANEVPNYLAALEDVGRPPLKGKTLGICKEYYFENLDPEIEKAVLEAVNLLTELGAKVVEVSVPSLPEVVRLQGLITTAEAYAYHSAYLKDRYEEYGTNIRARLEMGQYIPAWAYVEAQRLRQQYKKEWAGVYEKIDLLVAPTTAIPAFPIGKETITFGGKEVNPRDLAILGRTSPGNFNGYPSISVPCGFTAGGLPIGLQIQGAAFDETLVFQAAYAYEQARAMVSANKLAV
jgi:aspartyl-tRNA(Asn)/glutamyl-tRNA(Gln) amidotransferase subunit A